MKSAIESRVRVDERGAVVFRDARLTPGEEVEIIVRPLSEPSTPTSFLTTASSVRIDAPSDFSLRFEEASHVKP